MSRWRFVIRSLIYHWRIHLAVMLGVAAATAVLTGALLVGDSVRGSLRQIALDRLGRIDHIIVAEQFFRTDLASELASQPEFQQFGWAEAVPAIILQGTVQLTHKAAPDDEPGGPSTGGNPTNPVEASRTARHRRAGQVTVLGADERFWPLGERYGPGDPVRPARLPGAGQIVLNAPLAEQLGAAIGDTVVVRLPRGGDVPADSPMGRKTDTLRNIAELEVVDIVPAAGLGRFSLSPSQQLPQVAYLDPSALQRALGRTGQVNAILVAGRTVREQKHEPATSDLIGLLRPSLADFGLRMKQVTRHFTDPVDERTETVLDYFSLSSDRMLIRPEVGAAAEQAFAADNVQAVFTYLANTIAKAPTSLATGGPPVTTDRSPTGEPPVATEPPSATNAVSRTIPYSTISALDATEQLGPFLADARPLPSLADNEIALNRWAADQLQAAVGDPITVTYFEPESTHGKVVERTAPFRLAAIVPLTEPVQSYSGDEPAVYAERPTSANDPDLTPEVAGVTDKASLDDWDPPFPFERNRIGPADDLYWENHRTTPKAFVALAAGRQLWASRFGHTTSLRIPASGGMTVESLSARLLDQLHRDRQTPGFSLLPVRSNAIQASSGSTPFDVLFLGFSMFVIASALMLVALLFRLGIEQRAAEIGSLLAVGLRRRMAGRLLGLEGGIVAAIGGLLGVLGGIGYAWLMLAGLKTWWVAAIVTPFVNFHFTLQSLAIGYFAGGITAVATFAWGIANLRRVPLRRLVAGQASLPPTYTRRRSLSLIFAWLLLVLGAISLTLGTRLGGEMQALAFFSSGSSLLAAGLLLARWWFRSSSASGGARGFTPLVPLAHLAFRNAARNPGRSTLTIGLVAAASFLILAVSAFQLQPSASGTGGFDWLAETTQPIYQNLATTEGRHELGIIGDSERLLSQSDIFGLRFQSGDDASCLNMFQAKRPRVIGVPPNFVSHFDNPQGPHFAFAASAPAKDAVSSNPWHVLAQPVVDSAVPVVLDKNTAMYALHLYGGVGEVFETVDDVTGRRIRFQVAGLLADTIFQGNLLVSEAHFRQLYPDVSGYGLFLVRAPQGQKDQVRNVLEDRLSDQGFQAADARRRMEALQVVQNTYLATFQSLGALGLLLGTFGLATVQVRSVLERRGELALLRAAGYRRTRLARMVLLENAVLLAGGLLLGIVAALVTVLPHMLAGGARVPVGTLAGMLALVLIVGLLSGLAAVRATLRAPLLPALRGE